MTPVNRILTDYDVKAILDMAVFAPSGDNGQPWKFEVSQNKITTILVKRSDESIYNFSNLGSYFSHGMLIDNIDIIAQSLGYNTTIAILPRKDQSEVTSEIQFREKKKSAVEHSLYPYILQRHTNRKFYLPRKLSKNVKEELNAVFSEIDTVKLHLAEDPKVVAELAGALSVNDRLIFENKFIHDGLFAIVNWTREDDDKKKTGLFIKTMELSQEQVAAFRQFQNWKIMKFLNSLHIPTLISKQNQRLYKSSAAIGAVTLDKTDLCDFISAGKALNRIWLLATKFGLSIHPVTGISYLAYRVKLGDLTHLDENDVKLIKRANKEIRDAYRFSDDLAIAMLFRIGYAEQPSARSRRKPPEIIYVN